LETPSNETNLNDLAKDISERRQSSCSCSGSFWDKSDYDHAGFFL